MSFNYEIKKVKDFTELPNDDNHIIISLNTSSRVPDINIDGDTIAISLVESIHDSMPFQFYVLFNDTLTKLSKNKNFKICRDTVIFDENDCIDMSDIKAIARTYLMMVKPYCNMGEDEILNIYINKENSIDSFFDSVSSGNKKKSKKDNKKNGKKNKKKGK